MVRDNSPQISSHQQNIKKLQWKGKQKSGKLSQEEDWHLLPIGKRWMSQPIIKTDTGKKIGRRAEKKTGRRPSEMT